MVAVLVFSLQFAVVQTYVTKKAAAYLSKELRANVSLNAIYFKPFSALILHDFVLDDPDGKRIGSSKRLYVGFSLSGLIQQRIDIQDVRLTEAYIDYTKYKDSSNFDFLIDYFAPKKKKPTRSAKKQMELTLRRIELADCHIRYTDDNYKHHNKGIDFSSLELRDLSGVFDHISLDTALRQVDIQGLTFREKSGFYLQELNTSASLANKAMVFEDLYLRTNRSLLREYLRFDFQSLSDFEDFVKKVHITAKLQDATVDSRDIAFFAPDVRFVQFHTEVSRASLSGTITDIKAEHVALKTKRHTAMEGNFTVKGLPDINKTIFDFSQITLRSYASDINELVRELSNDPKFILPEQLDQLAHIGFRGSFVGLYNDFEVDGHFTTALGEMDTRTSINIGRELAYQGELRSAQFDLGTLTGRTEIGRTGMHLTFDGQNTELSNLKLNLQGELQQLELPHYTIQALSVEASLENELLQLSGDVRDPEAVLDYDASFNLSKHSPTYRLASNLERLNLSTFQLLRKDSIIIQNTYLEADFQGSNINNLAGYLSADDLGLSTPDGTFEIHDLRFESSGDQLKRKLRLQSNVLDAELSGTIDLNTIGAYFQSLAVQYAPAIGLERMAFNDQNFDLSLAIKSFDPVSAFLELPLTLEDGATLKANFSSDDYIGNFLFTSPSVNYNGVKLSNVRVEEQTDARELSLRLESDRLSIMDSIFVNQITIDNILANDSLQFAIHAAEDTLENRLRLHGHIHFEQNKPAYIHFNESTIVLNDDPWEIQAEKEIRVSQGKLYFEQFRFARNEENVTLNGILSNQKDDLNISFNDFGLQSLEAITSPLGIHLRGEMNGEITITSVLQSPYFKANLRTSPIVYNSLPIGQLNLDANFNPATAVIDIRLHLLDELRRGFRLAGHYDLADKENPLQLRGDVRDMELVVFQPFLKDLAGNLNGKASAELQISGTFAKPVLSGTMEVQNAQFTVLYLNTTYALSNQSLWLENNVVRLDGLRIFDIHQHEAAVYGSLDLNQLSDPTMTVEARANNFQILNTTYKQNNLYYGSAFATGIFRFTGKTTNLNIDINATSNPNTVITIPLDAAMTISDSDFIYMVESDQEKTAAVNPFFFQGMTMNMALKLTPDAEINLHTSVGSLRGTGNGDVNMKISSRGDFEMFGDYSINSGKFHFVAQNIINKYFDMKPGGTIRWTGDPTQARLDITAFYQQRTAIADIYNAAGRQFREGEDERVLAQADMIITGTLADPDVSFDLSFPLTPYVKDELQAYLSDANNVNQQALSLIVRRSFTATNANNQFGQEVNNTLLSAGTELAFNQLNTIISESLNVNFLDLNIRSLHDASASVRLFDDRLVLTGAISDRRNIQNTDFQFFSNRVATDAELTYRIRRDGSLMFRAYNRLNTRNILFTPTDEYISAAGLVYRQEFNNFPEFFRRLFSFRRKEEERVELEVRTDTLPTDTTTTTTRGTDTPTR